MKNPSILPWWKMTKTMMTMKMTKSKRYVPPTLKFTPHPFTRAGVADIGHQDDGGKLGSSPRRSRQNSNTARR